MLTDKATEFQFSTKEKSNNNHQNRLSYACMHIQYMYIDVETHQIFKTAIQYHFVHVQYFDFVCVFFHFGLVFDFNLKCLHSNVFLFRDRCRANEHFFGYLLTCF